MRCSSSCWQIRCPEELGDHCVGKSDFFHSIFSYIQWPSKDDMTVRVYNYNTLERLHQFEAHSDYIRSIAVHPTQSYILTSSGECFVGET